MHACMHAVEFGGRTADVLAIGKPATRLSAPPYGPVSSGTASLFRRRIQRASAYEKKKRSRTMQAPPPLPLQTLPRPLQLRACLCMIICYPHTATRAARSRPRHVVSISARAAGRRLAADVLCATTHPPHDRFVSFDRRIVKSSGSRGGIMPVVLPAATVRIRPGRPRARKHASWWSGPAGCMHRFRLPLGGRGARTTWIGCVCTIASATHHICALVCLVCRTCNIVE